MNTSESPTPAIVPDPYIGEKLAQARATLIERLQDQLDRGTSAILAHQALHLPETRKVLITSGHWTVVRTGINGRELAMRDLIVKSNGLPNGTLFAASEVYQVLADWNEHMVTREYPAHIATVTEAQDLWVANLTKMIALLRAS